MKKSVLICNPNSGKNNKEVLANKFKNILNEYGYEVDIIFTKYAGHAKKIMTELSDDIDLNGAKIKPIGNSERPFSGEFDGNGCKISNFSVIADSDSYNVGLFGKCQNAQLSNIEIYNAHILGGQQVGGIVGLARDSKFDNCFFQGFIQGKKNIGGLIGTSKNNEIKNSATTCNIDSISDEDFNHFDFKLNLWFGQTLFSLICRCCLRHFGNCCVRLYFY